MMKTLFITLFTILLTNFTYAQQTYVPDDNFENYLETHDANGNNVSVGDANSMGNGVANDNYVLTSRINTVTLLQVNYQNISDLTGIEDFTNLQDLHCPNNQLTNLDISQNTNLQNLSCQGNQLTSLDVTHNTGLQSLSCSYNQLTSLDLSQNTNLVRLECNYNQLTNLDVSQNTSLNSLESYNNRLTGLNTQNDNNTNFTSFKTTGNPDLTCVFVDDVNYMSTNWPNAIDATATYVETQAECDALGINETFKEQIQIYPIPFNEYLNIKVPDEAKIKSINIHNIQGQIVYKSSFVSQIKLSNIPTGIYFLSVENKTGDKAMFKLIKN